MQNLKIFNVFYLFLLVLLPYCITSGSTQSLPHEKCSLQDSECLTTQAQSTLQHLFKGIPELGIKKQEKLFIDFVDFQWEDLTYKWTNITIDGMQNAKIDNVSFNMDLKLMHLEFHATLLVESNYHAEGLTFSTIYLFGNDKAHVTLKNFRVEMLIPFDLIKNEQGKDVMELKKHYYGFDVEHVHYQLDNLFNGDKKQSDVFHELMNTNWRTVLGNVAKYFNGKITGKIFDIIKMYMRSRPLQDLALY